MLEVNPSAFRPTDGETCIFSITTKRGIASHVDVLASAEVAQFLNKVPLEISEQRDKIAFSEKDCVHRIALNRDGNKMVGTWNGRGEGQQQLPFGTYYLRVGTPESRDEEGDVATVKLLKGESETCVAQLSEPTTSIADRVESATKLWKCFSGRFAAVARSLKMFDEQKIQDAATEVLFVKPVEGKFDNYGTDYPFEPYAMKCFKHEVLVRLRRQVHHRRWLDNLCRDASKSTSTGCTT